MFTLRLLLSPQGLATTNTELGLTAAWQGGCVTSSVLSGSSWDSEMCDFMIVFIPEWRLTETRDLIS